MKGTRQAEILQIIAEHPGVLKVTLDSVEAEDDEIFFSG